MFFFSADCWQQKEAMQNANIALHDDDDDDDDDDDEIKVLVYKHVC